jgi:hypothetical protein
MSPSTSSKSEAEEPSSYQHMEEALSKVKTSLSEDLFGSAIQNSTIGSNRTSSMVSSKDSNNYSLQSISNEASGSIIKNAPLASGSSSALPSNELAGEASVIAAKQGANEASYNSTSQSPLDETKPILPLSAGIESSSAGIQTTTTSQESGSDDEAMATATAAAVAAAAVAASSTTIPVPIHPSPTSERSTKSKGGGLRRGKWTAEEEAYVARVIQDFNSGFLNAPAGTTLRSYLSDKLQCDPMRITKKFTGESCIGKRVFHPAVRSGVNAATIDKAQVSNVLASFVE